MRPTVTIYVSQILFKQSTAGQQIMSPTAQMVRTTMTPLAQQAQRFSTF